MAHRVVHRMTKDGGNFTTLLEAVTDLRASVGNGPVNAAKVSAENSDGAVADVNRTTTFIAPNIIEITDVWTSQDAMDAHYTDRVKPAFKAVGISAGDNPGGWARTVISAEDI